MDYTNSTSIKFPVLPERWSDWTITDILGQGSFGTVYTIVKNEDTDDEVANALKIVSIPGDETEAIELRKEYRTKESLKAYYTSMSNEFSREIETMNLLKGNPYVVSIIDYEIVELEQGYIFYIQMELLTSLTDYFMMEPITEEIVIRMGMDITKCLEVCQKHRIIHRDIKPDNIFYNGTNFCLGDFGIARQVDPGQRTLSFKGSFSYMAPEIFHNEKYDSRVDIYSLGLVLYRLMNQNKEPFIDPDKQLVYYRDREDAMNKRMAGESLIAPIEASESFASVILKACEFSPEDRYQNPSAFLKDLEILSKGSVKGLSTKKKKTKQKKTDAQKKRPLFAAIGALSAVTIGLGIGLVTNITETGALPLDHPEQLILDKTEAKEAENAVESFDRLLWESAETNDYTIIQNRYKDTSLNWSACKDHYGAYDSGYTEPNYITIAQVTDPDTKEDWFCVTAIRCKQTEPFPDYTGPVDPIIIDYAVRRDADDNWKVTRMNPALQDKLSSFMPEEFQSALKYGRHAKVFDGYTCISENIDDENGPPKEALFAGVIEPALSAIWENGDGSLGVLLSVSNGSRKECIINSLNLTITNNPEFLATPDYPAPQVVIALVDHKEINIAPEKNRVASGEYLTYTNITIENTDIPDEYWSDEFQMLYDIQWDIDWESYED